MQRILVVDDWPQVVRAIHRELKGEFDVETATSASEALAVFDRAVPDAAIIDVLMAPDSGLVLAERLRARGFTGPILFISTCAEEELPHRVQTYEPAQFLAKPWSPGSLGSELHRMLGA